MKLEYVFERLTGPGEELLRPGGEQGAAGFGQGGAGGGKDAGIKPTQGAQGEEGGLLQRLQLLRRSAVEQIVGAAVIDGPGPGADAAERGLAVQERQQEIEAAQDGARVVVKL